MTDFDTEFYELGKTQRAIIDCLHEINRRLTNIEQHIAYHRDEK